MRFSLAIVAVATNAIVLELDSSNQAVLELGSFNEAISNANAAEAAAETEEWEALYARFMTVVNHLPDIFGELIRLVDGENGIDSALSDI